MTDIPNSEQTPAEQAAEYKIPVVQHDNPQGEAAPEVDSLVREYERKYQGFRDSEGFSSSCFNSYSRAEPCNHHQKPVTPLRQHIRRDLERKPYTARHIVSPELRKLKS